MASEVPPEPPPEFQMSPPPPSNPDGRRDFLIGLSIGAIPLVLALVGAGFLVANDMSGIGFGFLAGILYVLMLLVTVLLLLIPSARQVGQGMLAAVVVSLVIAFIGRVVVPSALRSRP
jgi:hypothetical protein